MNRRGFIMPVVVLLSLVASLTVVVVLNRNAVRTRDAAAQLDGYVAEHRERGIREVIAVWLQYTTRENIEELLEPDGLAFTLDYSGGRQLVVRLFESQSTALVNPNGLTPNQPDVGVVPLSEQRDLALAIGQALEASRPGLSEALGREAGPLAVSVWSAPSEVIEAITLAVTGNPDVASAFALLLARERDRSEELPTIRMINLAEEAGVEEDLRGRLAALFTTTPTLWAVRAELTGGGRDEEPIERYEALVYIPREDQSNPLLTGSEHVNAWFLEWDRLEVGEGYTPVAGGG